MRHEETVTLERIFFGAHQREVCGAREFQKSIDARGEIRRLSARDVIDQTIGTINARIIGTSAERFSEKLIFDFG